MAPWALARRPIHRSTLAPTRVQATSRPPHGMLARAALGHTDDDGQEVGGDPGPRQTAVDDTHVATGAIMLWTLLAEGERVMTEGDAIVFVVDDDAPLRESLTNLLRSVGLRVAAFASAQEFLHSPRPDGPSCLVLDVRLPGLSGLELQQRLVEADLAMPIIFMTGYGDIPMTVQAMKAGAVEFLTKPFRDQDLLDAIHQALAHNRHARAQRAQHDALHHRYRALTPRERDVLARVVTGLLNKQIAAELGTSEAAVKVHRQHVMAKMEAGSLAELVRMADRLGIPTPQV